jgi:hypothetical protein
MLLFLIRHAWTIVIGIVCAIAAIAGFWIHSWRLDRQTAADARELGAILVTADPGQRLSRLETYLAAAPQGMRSAVLFSMLESARQMGDYPKLAALWNDIGELDPAFRMPAAFGMASALAAQDKYAQALTVLDGLSAGVSPAQAPIVNNRIIAYAEACGDYARALAACDALLGNPQAAQEAHIWTQKKKDLERKKAAAAG